MKNSSSYRGFTLIELLVVIAIISILSSIVYASVALARTQAIDARKQADLTTIRTALISYDTDHGHMPHNYDCSSGSCVVNNGRLTLAIQDPASPGNPTTESGKAYNASMQELVALQYLPNVPYSPGGAGYTYYDYGPGSTAGAVIATTLDAAAPTTAGKPGTCRPFSSDMSGGISLLNTLKTGISYPSVLLASVKLAAAGFLGGGGPSGVGTCIYEENGVSIERPCPSDTTNICSDALSNDYCLCSTY